MTTHDVDALSAELIIQTARVLRLVRREYAPSAGTRVLSILDETGPIGITALAQIDRCSQPTMTGQVNQLVEQGWVTKEPHPADARSSLVTTTAAGRAELDRVRRSSAALVRDRLARRTDLTTDDLATTVAVLQAVLAPTEPSEGRS